MDFYIGKKIIKAIPMNREEYNKYRGWELPFDEDPTDEGMLVEYVDGGGSNHLNHDGYISWSPKDVFERAYLKFEGSDNDPEFIQRLGAEIAENKDKMTKLMAFLRQGSLDLARTDESTYLLTQQLQVMVMLGNILERRLELSRRAVDNE